MFNGSKFNSVAINSRISTIRVGGIGRRLPYIIELSVFLKLIGKKRTDNEKVYFNIFGKRTKELKEYILLSSKIQNYIKVLLEIDGKKSLDKYDVYDILGKKYAYKINNHFDFIANRFKLYKNVNLIGKKYAYKINNHFDFIANRFKLYRNVNLIGIKTRNTKSILSMYGIKIKDLPYNLTILGDIDYTDLFFILNL